MLDLSNHDESTFNAECLAAAGVTRVIMGCQMSGWPARRMIPPLRDKGIEVRDVYAFLGLYDYYREPTLSAIEVARQFGIPRVWLDAEGDDVMTGRIVTGVTPEQRIENLRQCVVTVENAGLDVGIYSASWFWLPYMNNTPVFGKLDWWLGGPYQVAPISTANFGGIERVVMHQYTSSFPVCGRGRDANYVFEENDDMGMTPAEREWVDGLAKDLEKLKAIVVTHGIDTDLDGVVDMVGEAALTYAFEHGWSAFYGGSLNKKAIADHVRTPHGGASDSDAYLAHVHQVELELGGRVSGTGMKRL